MDVSPSPFASYLADSKTVGKVKHTPGKGSLSSSRRMKGLLAKLSADGMSSQWISTIDFTSPNLAKCTMEVYALCKGTKEVDTECLSKVNAGLDLHLVSMGLLSEMILYFDWEQLAGVKLGIDGLKVLEQQFKITWTFQLKVTEDHSLQGGYIVPESQ